MRVDVVIDFYRKEAMWPLVVWGLQHNTAHINRVIVVNDEPWGEWKPTLDDIPLVLLDHEHDGFGSHRCTNQGMREVETEYWAVCNADVIMMPGALEALCELAEPQAIVYPETHHIEEDTDMEELEAGPTLVELCHQISPYVMKYVRHEGGHARPYYHRQPWSRYRDLFTLEHASSSKELGGRTEWRGYGYIDYDYGCRWAMKYGLDRVKLTGPQAYTFRTANGGHATDTVNEVGFTATLKQYVDTYYKEHGWIPNP
jgi:hypothetical protein